MKISRNWLQTYVDLTGRSADEISRAITFLGFEVEGVALTGAPKLEQLVVGEILTRAKHPNADKLSVCTVDIGPAGGVKTIVCGASNCDPGRRVPVALPGAVLPGNFTIKQSQIRGQLSDGMMCSAKELALSDEAAGLLVLDGSPALGTPINAVLPPGDTVFDIEITPTVPTVSVTSASHGSSPRGSSRTSSIPKCISPRSTPTPRRAPTSSAPSTWTRPKTARSTPRPSSPA